MRGEAPHKSQARKKNRASNDPSQFLETSGFAAYSSLIFAASITFFHRSVSEAM